MAVSDHWHKVAKIRARIIECDPANNVIDVQGGDGGMRRIMVWEVAADFRWPVVGEDWSIYEQNGSWYLGERINNASDDLPITTLQPGDQRLDGLRIFNRKGRLIVHGDYAGITNGQGLFWNSTQGTFLPGREIPSGGTTGQTLAKSSNANYDIGWVTPTTVTLASLGIARGAGSIAFSAAQSVTGTVTHGLGVIPTHCEMQQRDDQTAVAPIIYQIYNATTTQWTFRGWSVLGPATATNNYSWLAIA